MDKCGCRYGFRTNAPDPFDRGYWTATSMSRFAADTSLSTVYSHAALYRLFDACAEEERDRGAGSEGRLSFAGFELLLITIATRPLCREGGRGRRGDWGG